ncbi:hypothetical protein QYE76_040220 [Lolium multiflorum]|uniref:FACT complex subunit n=1 Tax=Lolium multiflorum TaxID=4521 RepID=A0AAD8TCK1_LOLMU|nr:hypothetical protein QYE76_040220 [Lolium multiflorum]
MADNGKAKPASGGAYTINLDNFSKRLKVFYDHGNGNKTDFWEADTPVGAVHFLCSQKKANLIGTLKNAAHEAVGADIILHVKGKNGDGINLMDDILSAACAQSKSDTPVVGHCNIPAAEIEIKKEHQVLMVNKTTSFKKQGKSKGKFKKGGKKAATPPMKPKNGPKPDAECYYCKEKGHWKRNCSKYLADLKSGLVKKKKEGMEHWTAVKNIPKYLKRTKDMFLCYGGDQELVVSGYTDESWNTDPDDSKSQSVRVYIEWCCSKLGKLEAVHGGEVFNIIRVHSGFEASSEATNSWVFHLYNEGQGEGAGHPNTTRWPHPNTTRWPHPNTTRWPHPNTTRWPHPNTTRWPHTIVAGAPLSQTLAALSPPPLPARLAKLRRFLHHHRHHAVVLPDSRGATTSAARWNGEVDVDFINTERVTEYEGAARSWRRDQDLLRAFASGK